MTVTSAAGAQAARMKTQINKLLIFFMQFSILFQNKSTKQIERLMLRNSVPQKIDELQIDYKVTLASVDEFNAS